MATVDERRQELGDGVVGVTVDQVQAGHCALNQSGADLMRKELRREVFHESAKERMLFPQGGWQTERGGGGGNMNYSGRRQGLGRDTAAGRKVCFVVNPHTALITSTVSTVILTLALPHPKQGSPSFLKSTTIPWMLIDANSCQFPVCSSCEIVRIWK